LRNADILLTGVADLEFDLARIEDGPAEGDRFDRSGRFDVEPCAVGEGKERDYSGKE